MNLPQPRPSIKPCELPPGSFLRQCREDGCYTDCYVIEIDGAVSQAAFVEAFYTTPLFKLERGILHWLAGKPATDLDARQLGLGTASNFSAWRVERRDAQQLLLADFTGRTKSCLMAVPQASSTLLYFGSAVVPKRSGATGKRQMGLAFSALLGFHRLYSRLLLKAARSRLR